MSSERVSPFGDLADFAPKDKKVPGRDEKAVIEQVAADNGFPSRQPVKVAPTQQQRRHRTGRNQQINIKATAETVERMNRIADDLRIPLGEVLERALDALEKAT
jgi:hypothetical protein